tara:strand:- start:18372 stop:19367 length:996 start_codon:yes stop_codon:yes gene_type:complete
MNRNAFVLPLLAAILMPVQSQAITGGPWDHLFPEKFSRNNTDGVYEAVVSLTNGSGFIKFESQATRLTLDDPTVEEQQAQAGFFSATTTSTDVSTTLAAVSNSIIFFQGNSYFGNTFGSVDAQTGDVSGSTTGQSSIVSNIENSLSGLTDTAGAAIDVSGLSETMNMSFTGNITERNPQVRFEAEGDINFLSRPPINFQFITQTTPGAQNNPPTTTLVATIAQIAAGGSTTESVTTTGNETTTTQDSTVITTTTNDTVGNTTTNTVRTQQTGSGPDTNTIATNRTRNEPTESSGAPLEPDLTRTIRLFGGRVALEGVSAGDATAAAQSGGG